MRGLRSLPSVLVIFSVIYNWQGQRKLGGFRDWSHQKNAPRQVSERVSKVRILSFLRQNETKNSLDEDVEEISELITDLYYPVGDEPVVIGMERCAEFRRQFGPNRTIGMAGLFNSGTNALLHSLQANIGIPGNNISDWGDFFGAYKELNGIQFQVPWWKHNPQIGNWSCCGRHCCGRHQMKHRHILPVVVVRDPISWRHSMCTAPYNMYWDGSRSRGNLGNCPVMNHAANGSIVSPPVYFHIKPVQRPKTVEYTSLVQVWNEFYGSYVDATYPRLIVRQEDVLLQMPKVVEKIRKCIGGYSKHESFRTLQAPVKTHGNSGPSDLSSQIRRIAKRPVSNMSRAEVLYTRSNLSPMLMDLFQYKIP